MKTVVVVEPRLLRDELSRKDDALDLIAGGLEEARGEHRIELLLQANIVYGERWDMNAVRSHLEEIRSLTRGQGIPIDLQAGILRQEASLAQQDSINSAQRAESLFTQEMELRRQAANELDRAWAQHNLAVTLHKQAKHQQA